MLILHTLLHPLQQALFQRNEKTMNFSMNLTSYAREIYSL
jgi:hypothetical protein